MFVSLAFLTSFLAGWMCNFEQSFNELSPSHSSRHWPPTIPTYICGLRAYRSCWSCSVHGIGGVTNFFIFVSSITKWKSRRKIFPFRTFPSKTQSHRKWHLSWFEILSSVWRKRFSDLFGPWMLSRWYQSFQHFELERNEKVLGPTSYSAHPPVYRLDNGWN